MCPALAFASECPSCAACALVSPPSAPERLWVDSLLTGGWDETLAGWLDLAPLYRCPGCGVVDRPRGAPRLAPPLGPRESLPLALPASESDYLDALAAGSYAGRDEKLLLRVFAWRRGCDAIRGAERAQIPSAAAQANLEALFDLLCEDTPAELLLKAEVARHLSEFSEGARLLALLPRRHHDDPRACAIRAATSARTSAPVRVGERWTQRSAFSCSECAAPGRAHPRYVSCALVEGGVERTDEFIVACGRCGAANWLGGASRREGVLERLPLQAGCLGGALLVAALFLSSLAPAVARGLALAAYATWGLGALAVQVLRRWAPNSRSLTPDELYAQLAAQTWEVPLEERALRCHVFRTAPERSPRGLANERALAPLLGELPADRLLLAQIFTRQGRDAEATEIRARLSEESAGLDVDRS